MATGCAGSPVLLWFGFPPAGLPVSSVWHLQSVVVAPLAAAPAAPAAPAAAAAGAAAAAAFAVGTAAAAAAFAVGTAGVDTGGWRTLLVDTFGVEEAVALVGTVLVEDKIASWEAALQTMLRACHTM